MRILAFGIIKDIFNSPVISVDCRDGITADELKLLLNENYPGLNSLGSYMIAVNNEYAQASEIIYERDEVALIPPVSGG